MISTSLISKEYQRDVTFKDIIQQAATIQLAPAQLDFELFFQTLVENSQMGQTRAAADLLLDLSQFSAPNICQSIAIAEIRTTLENVIEREKLTDLTKRPANQSALIQYKGSFQNLDNGKRWYKHWLKSWLLSDVSVSELENIALKELTRVKKRRESLIKKTVGTQKSNGYEFLAADKASIIQAFRGREQSVKKHLDSLFGLHKNIAPLKIVESSLPKSFPAPGIYNNQTQEFIYHLQSNSLPERFMDWLFIHEGLPGHHYQSQIAINSPLCPTLSMGSLSSVFAEGWGAYVETIGSKLGLYNEPASESYALDWQALRAVRVLLDIGIHYHGWSDKKAREVWMQHIPSQKPIMEREIKRIHNWPVQVITYVYGKHKIEENIQTMQAKGYSLKKIHQSILFLSNKSLKSLKFIEKVINSSDKKKGK